MVRLYLYVAKLIKERVNTTERYIIMAQVLIGGACLVVFYMVLKGKDQTIATERKRNDALEARLAVCETEKDKKNTFILEVLIGLNAKTEAELRKYQNEKK